MLCPACQFEIPDRAKFCLECGTNLSALSGEESPPATHSPQNVINSDSEASGPYTGSTDPPRWSDSLGDRMTVGATMRPPVSPVDASLSFAGIPLAERYEVLGELGRGGFGVVFQARDKKLGRHVAIKRLLVPEEAGRSDQTALDRFIREARTIAALNHRHIVQVFDHDRDHEGHYIVMEYIDGGTLARHLKARGRLPIEEAVSLVRGIAQGLGFAHRRNLVHRDVKPANILLLDEQGTLVPKIVDFGLARGGGGIEVSVSGYGLGTPHYMPPEQRRDAKNVNHTADIYALGKTLYELVTGEIPDNVDPDLIPQPASLSRVIFKCLKTNPADRYFSMEELAAELEQIDRKAASVAAASVPVPVAPDTANACVHCGAVNGETEKFCFQCGTSLFKTCPECQRENGARVKFCGGCGTEIDAFAAIRNVTRRMEECRREKRWDQLLKEGELAPDNARLPGNNGAQLSRTLHSLRKQAQEQMAERERLRAEIRRALEQPDFQAAETLRLVDQFQAIDTDDEEINRLVESLKAQARAQQEAAEWQSVMAEIRQMEGSLDYDSILRRLEDYVSRAGGTFRGAAEREIDRIRSARWRRRFKHAIELKDVNEARKQLEAARAHGASVEELGDFRAQIDRLDLDLLQQQLDDALKREQLQEARRLLQELRERAAASDSTDSYEQSVLEQSVKRLEVYQAFRSALPAVTALERERRFAEAADALERLLAEQPLVVSLGLVEDRYLPRLRRAAIDAEFESLKRNVAALQAGQQYGAAIRLVEQFVKKIPDGLGILGCLAMDLLSAVDKACFDHYRARAEAAETQRMYAAALESISQYLSQAPNGEHLSAAESELRRLKAARTEWEAHGKKAAFAAEEAKRLLEMAEACNRAGNPERAAELLKKVKSFSNVNLPNTTVVEFQIEETRKALKQRK